jgi:colicin import membrane protein
MKKGQQLIHAEKKFLLWLAVAAAMHVLLLLLALYLQVWDAGRHSNPPKIVSVSLVSLPGSGGAAGFSEEPAAAASLPAAMPKQQPKPLPEPQPAPLPPPVKAKAKQPVPQEPVAPPPSKLKTVSEVSQKPKPVDKQEQINKALDRLKQVVDKKSASESQSSSAGNLNKALAQLQQKVKAEGTPGGAGSGGGKGRSTGGRGGSGGGPYKARIASIIQQNWEFSRQMVNSSYGMEVYVRINIFADGTIRQIIFDRRAPSEYLNNSVKKALERSSPLPDLPKDEGSRDVWIGFVFTPEGIEK